MEVPEQDGSTACAVTVASQSESHLKRSPVGVGEGSRQHGLRRSPNCLHCRSGPGTFSAGHSISSFSCPSWSTPRSFLGRRGSRIGGPRAVPLAVQAKEANPHEGRQYTQALPFELRAPVRVAGEKDCCSVPDATISLSPGHSESQVAETDISIRGVPQTNVTLYSPGSAGEDVMCPALAVLKGRECGVVGLDAHPQLYQQKGPIHLSGVCACSEESLLPVARPEAVDRHWACGECGREVVLDNCFWCQGVDERIDERIETHIATRGSTPVETRCPISTGRDVAEASPVVSPNHNLNSRSILRETPLDTYYGGYMCEVISRDCSRDDIQSEDCPASSARLKNSRTIHPRAEQPIVDQKLSCRHRKEMEERPVTADLTSEVYGMDGIGSFGVRRPSPQSSSVFSGGGSNANVLVRGCFNRNGEFSTSPQEVVWCADFPPSVVCTEDRAPIRNEPLASHREERILAHAVEAGSEALQEPLTTYDVGRRLPTVSAELASGDRSKSYTETMHGRDSLIRPGLSGQICSQKTALSKQSVSPASSARVRVNCLQAPLPPETLDGASVAISTPLKSDSQKCRKGGRVVIDAEKHSEDRASSIRELTISKFRCDLEKGSGPPDQNSILQQPQREGQQRQPEAGHSCEAMQRQLRQKKDQWPGERWQQPLTRRNCLGAVAAMPVKSSTAAPLSLQHRMRKTRMCRFNQEGRCSRGSDCLFAHSISELRGQPDLFKTKLCEDFSASRCSRGDSCPFAHSAAELRWTPEFYKTALCPRISALGTVGMDKGGGSERSCPAGNGCRYAHSIAELRRRHSPLHIPAPSSNSFPARSETNKSGSVETAMGSGGDRQEVARREGNRATTEFSGSTASFAAVTVKGRRACDSERSRTAFKGLGQFVSHSEWRHNQKSKVVLATGRPGTSSLADRVLVECAGTATTRAVDAERLEGKPAPCEVESKSLQGGQCVRSAVGTAYASDGGSGFNVIGDGSRGMSHQEQGPNRSEEISVIRKESVEEMVNPFFPAKSKQIRMPGSQTATHQGGDFEKGSEHSSPIPFITDFVGKNVGIPASRYRTASQECAASCATSHCNEDNFQGGRLSCRASNPRTIKSSTSRHRGSSFGICGGRGVPESDAGTMLAESGVESGTEVNDVEQRKAQLSSEGRDCSVIDELKALLLSSSADAASSLHLFLEQLSVTLSPSPPPVFFDDFASKHGATAECTDVWRSQVSMLPGSTLEQSLQQSSSHMEVAKDSRRAIEFLEPDFTSIPPRPCIVSNGGAPSPLCAFLAYARNSEAAEQQASHRTKEIDILLQRLLND